MRVLQVPGFRPLLAGEAVNAIGNWIAVIAIWGFAAYEFDADAGDLATLIVVLSLPGAFLGPLLGVAIDRLGPRRALMLANALGCLNALALTQASSYEMVILLALPLGLIEGLASASLDALPPRLVSDEQLVRANAFLGGAQDAALVIGPIVAAAVNARWGLAGAFYADALTFVVGFAVAARLKIPDIERAEPDGVWRELRSGMGLVRRVRGLRWTLSVSVMAYTLWGLFAVLEPLYVRDVLAESDTVFALLQTVFGIGMVGAGITLAALGDRVARPRYVAIATIVSGATAALYLGTQSLAVAFVGVFLWGVDVAFFYVPAKTLLQRFAPTAAHGRVLALNQSLEPAAAVVVTPLAAVALGFVSVQALGLAGGAAIALGGVVALVTARRIGPVPKRTADPTTVTPHSPNPHSPIPHPGPTPG